MIILRMLWVMNKHLFSFFLIVILIPYFGHSQTNDTKLWTGLALEKDISKKIKGSIELEQRFDNNISSFDRLLIEPALSYKLSKKWSFDLIYRIWSQQTRERNYQLHSRLSLGTTYSKSIDDFKLEIGSKLQYGFADLNEDNFYSTKNLISRNNIKISYEIFGSRFTPFVKYELFTSLKRFEPENYQWRLFGGTNIYLNQKSRLRLFYALEHEFNKPNRVNSNILGISFQYSL